MNSEYRQAYENEQVVSRWDVDDESDDEGGDDGKEHGEDARRTALEMKCKLSKEFDKIFNIVSKSAEEIHVDTYSKEHKVGRMDAATVAAKFLYGKSLKKLDKKEKQEVKEILDSLLSDSAGRYQYSVLKGCLFEDKERLEGKFSEKKLVKMTMDQEYEFKTAFCLIVGSDDMIVDEKISVDQIEDVFTSIGFTMQDYDLENIINAVDLDVDGMIAYEDLRDAYEEWRKAQMEVPIVQGLFNMLIEDKNITKGSEYPAYYKGKRSGDATITHHALRNVVNKVMHLHGKHALKSDAEVRCLVDEIASEKDRKISFKDFITMFSGLDL